MSQLPTEAWIVVGVIIAATVVCLLYSLANDVRLESQIHDTRIKARNLRDAYALQLAAFEARQAMNEQVAIVGQGSVNSGRAADRAA